MRRLISTAMLAGELKAALTIFVEKVKEQKTAMEAAGDDFDKFADVEDSGFEEAGEKLEALCA